MPRPRKTERRARRTLLGVFRAGAPWGVLATLLAATVATTEGREAPNGVQTSPTPPFHESFDANSGGELPPGWRFQARGAPFRVVTSPDGADCQGGCVRIVGPEVPVGTVDPARLDRPSPTDGSAVFSRPDAVPPQAASPAWSLGNLAHGLSADAFRGRRIALVARVRREDTTTTAAGRAQGGGPTAHLWLRIDRPDGSAAWVDAALDRPIVDSRWRSRRTVVEVPRDAARIHFGVFLRGGGAVWVDDVRVEDLGPAAYDHQPPRELTARGLVNLQAFAQLYGLIRFFHPSDESANAEWNQVALRGIAAVEEAPAEELRRRLEEIFLPLAPTFRLSEGEPTAELRHGSAPQGSRRLVWRHRGVGLDRTPGLYSSRRIQLDSPRPRQQGWLFQTLEAKALAGGGVRFSARVWDSESHSARATAGVLRIEAWAGRRRLRRVEASQRGGPGATDGATSVRRQEVGLTLPAETTHLRFGLTLNGPGRVWIDEARLADGTDGRGGVHLLANPSFEEDYPPGRATPSRPVPGWRLDATGVNAGFTVGVGPRPAIGAPGKSEAGGRAAWIAWRPPPGRDVPEAPAPLVQDLGGGLRAWIPVAVETDEKGTLPRATGAGALRPHPSDPNGSPGSVASRPPELTTFPAGTDRTTRLAGVVIAWSIFEHFHPTLDRSSARWSEALPAALSRAATDRDGAEYLETLDRLLNRLDDGHAGALHPERRGGYRPSMDWFWTNDGLVLGSDDQAGTRGAVVLAVDGRSTLTALAEAMARTSAATQAHLRRRALDALADGLPGEPLELRVRTPAGEERTVVLPRLPPSGPAAFALDPLRVEGETVSATGPPEKRQEKQPGDGLGNGAIRDLGAGRFLVDLRRLDDGAFAASLNRLAQATGLIFELRGYPGGLSTRVLEHLLDRPVTSPRWAVPVRSAPGSDGLSWEESRWTLRPARPRLEAPAVFLVDERTVSYGETYAAIVAEHDLGFLVGSPTAGTNGNINAFTLPGGFLITWTGMRVLDPEGRPYHGRGVHPDRQARPSADDLADGRDPVLAAALALLEEKATSP